MASRCEMSETRERLAAGPPSSVSWIARRSSRVMRVRAGSGSSQTHEPGGRGAAKPGMSCGPSTIAGTSPRPRSAMSSSTSSSRRRLWDSKASAAASGPRPAAHRANRRQASVPGDHKSTSRLGAAAGHSPGTDPTTGSSSPRLARRRSTASAATFLVSSGPRTPMLWPRRASWPVVDHGAKWCGRRSLVRWLAAR